MKKILKQWKWIVLVIVIGVISLRAYQRFGVEPEAQSQAKIAVVETYNIAAGTIEPLDAICFAEATTNIEITPEVSGVVRNININDGDEVLQGDILFELDNIQQRVALQDAQVALDSTRLSLSELRGDNNLGDQSSLLQQTKNQQDILVEQARNNLFNTDLRAYPLDDPEDVTRPAPQIIGNYICEQEGEYIIEVYQSNAESGASYRYSGIESGRSSASTTSFGTDLGNCGLELIFNQEFDKNEDWVIPVPNIRSSQYSTLLRAYQQAIENRDIALNQTAASPELIAQQEGRVTQASLRYQLAQDNFEKTRVRAESNGIINGFNIDEGDFVNAFSSIASLKTIDQLELTTFVSLQDRNLISTESLVRINEDVFTIGTLAQSSNSDTRRFKITIPVGENNNYVEGEQYNCSIERNSEITIRDDGGFVVPLSAISIIGTDSYVFTVDQESLTQAIPVETGALLGTDIVVYGLDQGIFIKDARGVINNQQVSIATK